MNPTPQQACDVLARADCLHDRREMAFALDQLSVRMTVALGEMNPLLLCVMTGGMIVTAELARRFRFPLTIDYLHATRYGDSLTGSEVTWLARPTSALEHRNVVLVDDILDRGNTLAAARAWVAEQGAASVLTAVLVDKAVDAPRPVTADFAGVRADDRYLFGCGMDWHGYWRNLPEVYALHPDDEAAESEAPEL